MNYINKIRKKTEKGMTRKSKELINTIKMCIEDDASRGKHCTFVSSFYMTEENVEYFMKLGFTIEKQDFGIFRYKISW